MVRSRDLVDVRLALLEKNPYKCAAPHCARSISPSPFALHVKTNRRPKGCRHSTPQIAQTLWRIRFHETVAALRPVKQPQEKRECDEPAGHENDSFGERTASDRLGHG
jgi:hypothetical protein